MRLSDDIEGERALESGESGCSRAANEDLIYYTHREDPSIFIVEVTGDITYARGRLDDGLWPTSEEVRSRDGSSPGAGSPRHVCK